LDSLPLIALLAFLAAAILLYGVGRSLRRSASTHPTAKPAVTRQEAEAERALQLKLKQLELEHELRANRQMGLRR